MDQDSFIRRYGSEWHWLKSTCSGGGSALNRLTGEQIDDVVRSYLRVSGQLAEARGRYRDPALLDHVNDVVRTAQVAVYAGVPRAEPSVLRLFGHRYRDAARKTAGFILIAAVLMLVTTLGSWWWVANSSEARANLFPAGTVEDIRQSGGRDPEIAPTAGFATFLFVHNVEVSFFAFALGITAGVGTLWLIAQNGIMLGTLAGAYSVAGKTGMFWALILPHGLLELTAICIGAGAGLQMGWAIIDPGEQLRAVAIPEAAREASLVVLGVIPAFAIAATIESFISGTAVPDPVQMFIGIAASGGYLLFLLGVAPFRIAGRHLASFLRYSLPRAFMSK